MAHSKWLIEEEQSAEFLLPAVGHLLSFLVHL
jgi:hypothetical protein